ncbi:imidazole glycerol phosphate synthase subunit HisH [Deinococcus sp. KNUC1210]|uniref:imidazole glycerol phosphate synthase subunit HisH n=1 Tax=Deinococcus sp. KNUC1210 TaxID=2917691 RepID=UPI001EF0A704|nr:imidazole glycerol phosphate synthase subunit HisH [Deinococcus sp. KNUC1210]ULH15761.1 imidazole glycerol phosphate synthase subunit HisH [Deinococcus sp. KNUC1210]
MGAAVTSDQRPVAVLDYGGGNVHSCHKAFVRAGMDARIIGRPDELEGMAAIVVPGQGHFRQVMEAFDQSGFRAPLLSAAAAGTPIFGICVGMQMLLDASEEAPGVAGLGLLPGTVRRFEPGPGAEKVPHMGWNSIDKVGDSPLLRNLFCPAYTYFVHSYYVPLDVEADAGAITEYGVPFWSVLSQGNIHATQFHPEKSGEVGLAILRRFKEQVLG